MKENKAFVTLRGLSNDEQAEFSDFISSPYFNKNKEVTDYFNALLPHIVNNSIPDGEHIFKQLYQNKTFEPRKISDLSYLLLKLLKDYLTDKNYRNKDLLRQNHLLEQAQEARLEKIKILFYETFTDKPINAKGNYSHRLSCMPLYAAYYH